MEERVDELRRQIDQLQAREEVSLRDGFDYKRCFTVQQKSILFHEKMIGRFPLLAHFKFVVKCFIRP